MKNRKWDQISIGISYVVWSIFFVWIILLPLYLRSYGNKNYFSFIIHFLTYLGIYTSLYIILNIVLSLIVGISVLLIKGNWTGAKEKITLVIGGVLVLLDVLYIVEEIKKRSMHVGTPWGIIILFGIHLTQFMFLLKILKTRTEHILTAGPSRIK